MTPSIEGSHLPNIAIPDVRVVLDNCGAADNNSMPSLEDASFHTIVIPESPDPNTAHETSVALLHRETALTLRSESIVAPSTFDPRSPPYRISEAAESGLGVFAATSFERGECIMRERPLIIYPQVLPFHTGRTEGQQYPELDRAIGRMSSDNRNAFLNLMNAQAGEPSPTKGIIDTNALFIGPLPGAPYHYAAVCKDISRINHSCTPNAAYHFDPHTFTFSVHALAPIPSCAQIFISYIDPALPHNARQALLSSSYDFTCACAACTLPSPARAQSDARRALIARADAGASVRDAALDRWVRSPSNSEDCATRSVGTMDKMYADLFEKEGLYYEPVWEGCVARLCKAACALGDAESTRQWAELAAALNRAYTGGDRGWGEVAAKPERTDWWGARARKPELPPGRDIEPLL